MPAKRLAPPASCLVVAPLLLLVACGSPSDGQDLTGAEERQLDEAAAALDETQADYEEAIQLPDVETDPDALEEQDEH